MSHEAKPGVLPNKELAFLRRQIAELQAVLNEPASVPGYVPGRRDASQPVEAPTLQEPELPAIVADLPLGVALMDHGFRFLKVNKALLQLLGYSREEIVDLTLWDLAGADDLNRSGLSPQNIAGGVQAEFRVEIRLQTRSRENIWCRIISGAVRQQKSSGTWYLALIEDISERKRFEESLRKENQLYRQLVHSSKEGMFAFDREGNLLSWNPGMERLFGFAESEALGRNIVDLFPFFRQIGEERYLALTLQGESPIARDGAYYMVESGRQGTFETYFTPVHGDSAEVIGGLAILRDTTERDRAEKAQQAIEERYSELFENAQDLIYTHDLEGNLLSINKAADRITGYSRAELLKMNFFQIVAPEWLEPAKESLERLIAGDTGTPFEIEITAKEGSRAALEIVTRLILREGKAVAVQGIARDIARRKKAEEALHQANLKLKAWVEELEQRTRDITLLSEMGDMLRACFSMEEAYNVIVRVAQQIFPAQVGALYVIAPSRNLVEAVAVWGNEALLERVFPPDECWALRRGRVHWIEDAHIGLLCKHLHHATPGGYLCVPMMAQSEALGILHLTQPERVPLAEAKQRLAVTMAEHIAMALSNLRLHETLRSQSIRDPITGLFNRHFMEEALELELRRAVRSQSVLGVIMLEIDRLKAVNNGIGRDSAEVALREVGAMLRAVVRKEDIACRYGSEKFIVILPRGSFDITRQRAESLREMIKGLQVKHHNKVIPPMTASIGVAIYPEHGRTVEALLGAAEAALHRAKGEGGDRLASAR